MLAQFPQYTAGGVKQVRWCLSVCGLVGGQVIGVGRTLPSLQSPGAQSKPGLLATEEPDPDGGLISVPQTNNHARISPCVQLACVIFHEACKTFSAKMCVCFCVMQ